MGTSEERAPPGWYSLVEGFLRSWDLNLLEGVPGQPALQSLRGDHEAVSTDKLGNCCYCQGEHPLIQCC